MGEEESPSSSIEKTTLNGVEIEGELFNDLPVLNLPSKLDYYIAPDFRRAARQALKNEVADIIVFDLRRTQYIDSTCLGVIIGSVQHGGRYRKEIVLGGPLDDNIERVLLLAGISRLCRRAHIPPSDE